MMEDDLQALAASAKARIEAAVTVEELEIVREALDELVTGRGQVLTWSGEAGVGKSRLIREVGDHTLHLASVERVEIQGGTPQPVKWRGATFQLRLEYPFLESPDVLDAASSALREAKGAGRGRIGVA